MKQETKAKILAYGMVSLVILSIGAIIYAVHDRTQLPEERKHSSAIDLSIMAAGIAGILFVQYRLRKS